MQERQHRVCRREGINTIGHTPKARITEAWGGRIGVEQAPVLRCDHWGLRHHQSRGQEAWVGMPPEPEVWASWPFCAGYRCGADGAHVACLSQSIGGC